MRITSSAVTTLAFLAASRAASLTAQPVLEVPPIDVVGDEPEASDAPSDAPASAFATRVTLSRAQEEGRSIADVLETLPSLHVRRLGGLGAYATLSIRGSSAAQVTVLVDGVPIAPTSDRSLSLDDLSVDAFEAIDVYRGVAPLALGGGFAIGGVVDLRTLATRAPMRLVAGVGSFGTYRLGLSAPARIGAIRLQAHTSVLASKGDFEFHDDRGTRQNATDDVVVRRRNADFALVESGARATARLGGRTTLDAWFAASAREGGVPGLGTFQATHARSRTLRTLGTIALTGRPAGAGSVTLRLSGRADATAFQDRENEVGLGPQDRHDTTLYAALALPVTLALAGGIAELAPEVSIEHNRAADPIAVVEEPGAIVRRRAGIGGAFERPFGILTLRAAGSFTAVADGHVLVETPIGAVAEADDRPVRVEPGAALGVRLDAAPWLSLRANGSYAVRSPTFEELFGNSGSVQGSPRLVAERAWGADAGATVTHGDVRATVAAYWQEVRDLIGFVQTSQRTARAANTGRARLRGLEASARVRPWPWLGGSLAVGVLDAENLTDVPSQRGKRIPGRPAFDLAAGADVTVGLFGLGADVDLVAGNFLDPANLQEVPARAFVGAVARFTPVPGLTFVVSVRNLLDHVVADVELHPAPLGGRREIPQAVSDYGGFPLPGRTLLFTVRWTQTKEDRP